MNVAIETTLLFIHHEYVRHLVPYNVFADLCTFTIDMTVECIFCHVSTNTNLTVEYKFVSCLVNKCISS